MRPLTKSERYLLAVLVDVVAIAAVLALGLTDKIAPTTTATVITGIVLARKPPVDVDDDNDPPSGRGPSGVGRKVRRALGAVSGVLTMCVPLFWVWHWIHRRVT